MPLKLFHVVRLPRCPSFTAGPAKITPKNNMVSYIIRKTRLWYHVICNSAQLCARFERWDKWTLHDKFSIKLRNIRNCSRGIFWLRTYIIKLQIRSTQSNGPKLPPPTGKDFLRSSLQLFYQVRSFQMSWWMI